MRIGHSQVDSQLGDFEGNLAKVVAGLERAERERVEIVRFPECFLTGYVRELKYKVELAITLAQNGPVERRHFQLDETSPQGEAKRELAIWMTLPLKAAQAAFTAAYLQQLSERFHGDKTRIAEFAGMDASTIRRPGLSSDAPLVLVRATESLDAVQRVRAANQHSPLADGR